jgi:hypothetical protein
MPQIPLTFTGNIDITVTCSVCHAPLEATIIVVSEQNQVVITLDPRHKCEAVKKIPITTIN